MSTSLPEREGDISISGRAIGAAIAKREHGLAAGTVPAGRLRTDVRTGSVQPGALWETLDQLEEDLARVFVRRRGQIVTLETLEADLRDSEELSDGTLTDERLVETLGTLREKLSTYPGVGRLLEVPGCGYVLWR